VRGSWDNVSEGGEMSWDASRRCYYYAVKIGPSGSESFQILVDDVWHQCIYPESEDSHYLDSSLCGPDSLGRGVCWRLEDCSSSTFEIRLRVDAQGNPTDLDWIKTEDGQARPTLSTTASSQLGDVAALDEVNSQGTPKSSEQSSRSDFGISKEYDCDSDGECHALCRQCGLPLPEQAYRGSKDDHRLLHAECMAMTMLDQLTRQDEERKRADRHCKSEKRKEYGIGWDAEKMVPSSTPILKKLGVEAAEDASKHFGLSFDEQASTVQAVPVESAAEAVNFAYLAQALRVRVREGREPMFSLDPLEGCENMKREARLQKKRFEPSWLAGTSLGEVLFQADYLLKELSMGEYEQPVLGMRSAHDRITEDNDVEWNAREWFAVKEARVELSDSKTLLPVVKMAVEAREQVRINGGLEDAPITRPDHPLVQYAEEFTANFDLIAERKSAIFHLREAAKATVLAKFLLDSKVKLEAKWFELSDEELRPCCPTAPQTWNERCFSTVSLDANGRLEQEEVTPKIRGVYGGVDLGLPVMPIAPGARPPPGPPPRAAGVRASGVRALRHKGVRLPAARFEGAPMAPVQAMRLAGLGFEGAPQGVDFNLDQFNLSELSGKEQQEAFDMGSISLSELSKRVFQAGLSDRTIKTAPWHTEYAYVQTLQGLINKEESLKDLREDLFLSPSFNPDEPGELFPTNWTATLKISHAQRGRAECLRRVELEAPQLVELQSNLHSHEPWFDEVAQDGTRFKIYTVDGNQVRTVQEVGEEEFIGCVLCSGPSNGQVKTEDDCTVKRVTLFVEHADSTRQSDTSRQYFVLLETQEGTTVLTDKLANGLTTWTSNPTEFQRRATRAKVLRSEELTSKLTLKDIRKVKVAASASAPASQSRRRRYAEAVLRKALGQADNLNLKAPASAGAVAAAGQGSRPRSVASAAVSKPLIKTYVPAPRLGGAAARPH